jgi:hypothetical protein
MRRSMGTVLLVCLVLPQLCALVGLHGWAEGRRQRTQASAVLAACSSDALLDPGCNVRGAGSPNALAAAGIALCPLQQA